MSRLGFYLHMDRCIGCGACQVSCKDHHSLQPEEFFRRVQYFSAGGGNQPDYYPYSGACNHCEHPKCVEPCPTGAMHQVADGTVAHDDGKCIGCGACLWNCPYGAVSFSKTKGITQKCDACGDLRALGQPPACVAACPTHALQFCDLEQVEEQGLVRDLPILPCSGLTCPSLRLRLPRRAAGKFAVPPPALHDVPTASQEASADRYCRDTDEVFLVLGCGAAGYYAACAIRERNRTCRIVMVGEEPCGTYSRPMLTKTALRTYQRDRTLLQDPDWYRRQRIETHYGVQIRSLDPAAKAVFCEGGLVFPYDRCVYALGATNFIPPIPGHDQQGVYSIRTDRDIAALKRSMAGARHAVIIGGGVIGLEAALELEHCGLIVTVLETAPMLMPRLLDEHTATLVERAMAPISIRVGVSVREISLVGGGGYVTIDEGERIAADLVVMATGVRANTAVAKEAGAAVERAIVVDQRMATSIPDLYACGDCAEFHGINYALWAQAQVQGTVAGANAAGEPLVYTGVDSSLILNSERLGLFAAGDLGKTPGLDYRIETNVTNGEHLFFVNPRAGSCVESRYYAGGELTGVSLVGNLSAMSQLRDQLFHQEEARRHAQQP